MKRQDGIRSHECILLEVEVWARRQGSHNQYFRSQRIRYIGVNALSHPACLVQEFHVLADIMSLRLSIFDCGPAVK